MIFINFIEFFVITGLNWSESDERCKMQELTYEKDSYCSDIQAPQSCYWPRTNI